MRISAVCTVFVAYVALIGLPARADDPPPAPAKPAEDADVAELRTHLAEYDAAGGGNTIPIEAGVLALAAAKPAKLVQFASHRRFGPLVISALGDGGATAQEADLVQAFDAHGVPSRLEAAIGLAALRTDGVRASLRRLADDAAVRDDKLAAARVRAALVRAGDRSSEDAVRTGLASKDAETVATALLVAGDARATQFLADAARLADDARKTTTERQSAWPESKTTTSADGLTTTTESVPVPLVTVGAVALEAASRMAASTLPEWVAWWAWPEHGPRFGRGADGVTRLRALATDDAAALKAKSPGGFAAVAAVVRHVAKGTEGAEFVLQSAAWKTSWTVTATVNGEKATFGVDASLAVTRR